MRKLTRLVLLLLVVSPSVPSLTREIVGGSVVAVECNSTDVQQQICSDATDCGDQKYTICIDNSDKGFEKDVFCKDGIGAYACSNACGGRRNNAESQSNCTTASVEPGL